MGLRIGGVAVPLSDLGTENASGYTLPSGANELQADFVGVSYGAGGRLGYEFRLDGGEGGWSPPSPERSLTLAHVGPGRHLLSIRARNAVGGVSPRPASVSFTVVPPVWQRGWFLALTAALLGFGLLGAHVLRGRRRAELRRIRASIMRDLHDDIGAGLSQIAILSEVAREKAEGNGDLLPRIAGVSRELVDSMADIVWAIDPAKDHLSDLTLRMRRVAGDLLTPRQIELSFTGPGASQDRALASEPRRQLYLVFKEGLSNAVRHSGCRNVDIEFRIDEAGLILRISDDGTGFDPVSASGGHGLHSMRDRARELGGTLEISSGAESGHAGTALTLRAPLPEQVGTRRRRRA